MNADNLERRRFNQSFQSERPTPRQKSSRISPVGGVVERMRRVAAIPSMFGICTSIRIRSKSERDA